LTSDRDHGDTESYSGIKVNDWNSIGNAKVFYVPEGKFSPKIIKKLSSDVDLVYVCGCFTNYAINTMLLYRLKMIKVPVVIAAMGLFSPLEFRRKYIKKKAFVTLLTAFGLFKHVFWSATSEMEIDEILDQVNCPREHFFIAEDLPRKVIPGSVKKDKKSGELKIVWISRIAPKKNLFGAIEILKRIKCNVSFSIYGTEHDPVYWNKCKRALNELPDNVKWEYCGNLDSERVVETLKEYHVFLFPTYGENYGHVIHEALSAGCPCILSNQTPWVELNYHDAGFVFDLEDIEKFIMAIEDYNKMNQSEFQRVSDSAKKYAEEVCTKALDNSGYKTIFQTLI